MKTAGICVMTGDIVLRDEIGSICTYSCFECPCFIKDPEE
jgi:hypothetical protein